MFPVFHLAWPNCRATKTFVAGWRKLLRKVERGSTLSNKFWLCCSFFIKLTTCRATNLLVPYKSTNQRAAFLQPATNVFVAGQVDQARWKTRNFHQNLQRNNVARQVEGFCISHFAALRSVVMTMTSTSRQPRWRSFLRHADIRMTSLEGEGNGHRPNQGLKFWRSIDYW